MSKSRRRVVASLLAAVAVYCSPPAFALNPRLDISQYAHTSWRIGDGSLPSAITAIAQTPDGYLWLGTDDGLLKFDGIKAAPWQPPSNQPLPSNRITNLTTTRDGSLWIGTDRGLVSWRDGRLTSYKGPEEPYRAVRILEDRDGVIWATVGVLRLNRRGLCSFTEVPAKCYGLDGGAGSGAITLFEGSQGQLWVGTGDGVWQWKPAPARFYRLESEIDGVVGLAEDAMGRLLIARRGRVERLINERIDTLFRFPPALKDMDFNRMLKDREGGLWLGGSSTGLLHFHQGMTDSFGAIDGLTSDSVGPVFEDREGSIWVATEEGLDRFRDVAVATISTRQGLSNPRANSFVASPDGSVWVSTFNGLAKMRDEEVIVYRERAAPAAAQGEPRISRPVRYVTGAGLPPAGVQALFRDSRGRIWASTESGVSYLEDDRFVKAKSVPGDVTRSITEDGHGTIWIANQGTGLYSLPQGRDAGKAVAWTTFGRTDVVTAVVGDPRRHGVWVGFLQGGLFYFDGRVSVAYGPADGLAPGRINQLQSDRDGTLWIAGEGGLTRLKDGRFATLNAAGGLPCDHARWALADDTESWWLAMSCGLVRVSSNEMAAWASAADRQRSSRGVRVTVFDNADGFRFSEGVAYTVPVVKSTDGRLWFHGRGGVNVLDPAFLPFNRVSPPVHIERITADRKSYDAGASGTGALRLPPLTRDLKIDYTALSLVAPERNQFRYKLEGRDTDWQDVGTRRQAFYSDLSPGQYRFRVVGSNNDGVWNETGATIDFEIAPAYYQTTWFMALVAGMLLTLVWAAHRIRLRIVETHEREITALNEKLMSAQEQERIRIAGELHDGVMQEMLAATMMLGAAKRRVETNAADAQATIDKVQQKLVQAGSEIRQLSHDLHPPALQDAGLPDALRSHCEQFSASCGIPIVCAADDRVHDLSRGAALALFRIVQEALANAAKHSRATRITVGLTRTTDEVTLAVSDDGVGFDRSRLTASGGLGLITMRERAGQLNGRFEFNSTPGRGTTITVVIPFR